MFSVAAGSGACDEPAVHVEAELAAAIERWETEGYTSYSMRLERFCFSCMWMTATVYVDAGSVVAFEDVISFGDTLSDSLLVAWNISLTSFKSVEGVFDIIATAIRQDAHSISASYHGELGYPESVGIDYWENAIDDEITYAISAVVKKP